MCSTQKLYQFEFSGLGNNISTDSDNLDWCQYFVIKFLLTNVNEIQDSILFELVAIYEMLSLYEYWIWLQTGPMKKMPLQF